MREAYEACDYSHAMREIMALADRANNTSMRKPLGNCAKTQA